MHGGYYVHSNVRYGLHNMVDAQRARDKHAYFSIKRLATRCFEDTQFNGMVPITLWRQNKSYLVDMHCYYWLNDLHVDRNV